MAYEYELNNFKAFAASGSIPLRPITLIYGPNSSGKSSLLQSLLLLKQTLDESETPETLLLPKGNLVDLGGYREFVHRHDTERPFTIRLAQTATAESTPMAGELGQMLRMQQFGIRISFGYDEYAANAAVREFAFYVDDLSTPLCTFERQALSPEELERSLARSPRSQRAALVYRGTTINKNHPFLPRIAAAEQEISSRHFKVELQHRLEMLRRRLGDLEKIEARSLSRKKQRSGSTATTGKEEAKAQISMVEQELRLFDRPVVTLVEEFIARHQRMYFPARNFLPGEVDMLPGAADDDLAFRRHYYLGTGAAGLAPSLYTFMGRQFRQFLENLVYLGPLRESPERHYVFSGNVTGQVGKTGRLVPDVLFKNSHLLQSVNQQLEAFGIGYDLIIAGSPGGELSDVFSLRLIDRVTGVNASILDVGFGISQVLPVIVQSMLSKKKTLCIEQPEIHLHPRLQAELGSLLATCTKSPYNNQFIVETHSQHLMLRIQKLIRLGELKPTDVSVLYMDRDHDGSHCLELRLDADGDFIDEWPHGFFEEGYSEIFSR